jgi:hypothetical protein
MLPRQTPPDANPKTLSEHFKLISPNNTSYPKIDETEELSEELKFLNEKKKYNIFYKYLAWSQRLGPFTLPLFIVLLIVLSLFIYTRRTENAIVVQTNPSEAETETSVNPIPVDSYDFVDLTLFKGKSKEDYALLLCTQQDVACEDQLNFEHFEFLSIGSEGSKKI